ncbi:Ketosteroid isomerase homolog [Fictibacillus solisalsi]|uniref:Ketosteroid isomerase homolog n=1 Tax=Fictibacillus solisalsi TaxID=459525 RepID=A0A1G9ZUA4_9BACL|nr:nuclear transport factor 2 family protein [Fictibacillus solisalsi]SDN24838.1 Ketosteroid isomerase homolog [Fictibacillus solisalsi]
MTVSMRVVQDVLDNYKSAVYEKDVERFLSGYAPDVHIYDCWGNWECRGIVPWKESVTEWFKGLKADGVFLNVGFNDLIVEENSNLAFIHCAVTFAAHHEESGEMLRQITNRFTFGLRKEKDSWLITHEHSSLPIDMNTGKGMFNLK